MTPPQEEIMHEVLALAQEALAAGEMPMAAVLVYEGRIVHRMQDRSIAHSDPTAHAEQELIRSFCREQQRISLEGYELYTLVEPCVMCSGAIKWARIDRVVYSLSQDELQQKSGGRRKPSCRELVNTGGREVVVVGGVLREEALAFYRAYEFRSKQELHRERYGPAAKK